MSTATEHTEHTDGHEAEHHGLSDMQYIKIA